MDCRIISLFERSETWCCCFCYRNFGSDSIGNEFCNRFLYSLTSPVSH
jgi:hypothetical protein